jgi:hypothetical protein
MAELLLNSLLYLFDSVTPDAQIVENMTWTIGQHPLASQSLYPTASFRVTKSIDDAISQNN